MKTLATPRVAVEGRQREWLSADGMPALLPPHEVVVKGTLAELVQGNVRVFGPMHERW